MLLSDEIYRQLHHTGKHVSVARFYPEGTIISSGISKWCRAGGWRLGTFAFPSGLAWLMEAMAVVASDTLPLDQALPDDFLESWCGEVIEATERIVEWVTTPRSSVVTI